MKHPCKSKWSVTARLLFGAQTTVYAKSTQTCAAYLLVVSRFPNRELRSEKGRKSKRIKEMKDRKKGKNGKRKKRKKGRKRKKERIKRRFSQ